MNRRPSAVLPQPSRLEIPRFRGLFASRNIHALAAHLGCSEMDARQLYELARIHGYGAAYSIVFPDGAAADRRRSLGHRDARGSLS